MSNVDVLFDRTRVEPHVFPSWTHNPGRMVLTLYKDGSLLVKNQPVGRVARPVELIIKNNISYKECTYIPKYKTLRMRINTLHYSPSQKKAGPYVS